MSKFEQRRILDLGLDLSEFEQITPDLSEGRPRVAESELRNTGFERRKTKDGWIRVEEHQNVTGSRRISPDLVQNSKYFAEKDDCFDSGQVSLVLKHKIDNAVGLESSDLRLTVGDVRSGDGRSSSGG